MIIQYVLYLQILMCQKLYFCQPHNFIIGKDIDNSNKLNAELDKHHKWFATNRRFSLRFSQFDRSLCPTINIMDLSRPCSMTPNMFIFLYFYSRYFRGYNYKLCLKKFEHECFSVQMQNEMCIVYARLLNI